MKNIYVLLCISFSCLLQGQKVLMSPPIVDEMDIVACSQDLTITPRHSDIQHSIFLEDFENAQINLETNNSEYLQGPFHIFARSEAQRFEEHDLKDADGLFFAIAQPLEKEVKLTSEAICIDGYHDLSLALMMASLMEASEEEWDDDASFHILFSIDDHAFQSVLDVNRSADFSSKLLNSSFQYISLPIPVTGDSLRIQIRLNNFNDPFETIAIDNLELRGRLDFDGFAFYRNIPMLSSQPLFVGEEYQAFEDLRQSQTVFVTSRLSTGEESTATRVSIELRETGSIACQDLINLSLGDDCSFELTSQYLTGTNLYDIELEDENGDTIANQIITRDHAETTIVYKLIDKCSGNTCWGLINVEIKRLPTLTSPCSYVEGEPVYCELWCGINEDPSGGFVTLEGLDSFLIQTCYPLVTNVFANEILIDTICEQETHIITYKGFLESKLGLEVVTILTQAYTVVQPDIELILPPHTVELSCEQSAEPDSIFYHFYNPGDSLSYVQSMLYSYPYLETGKTETIITLVEELDHFEILVDTIDEMVLLDDKWVILPYVRKQTADSIKIVEAEIDIPVITSFSENENICNLKVFKSDLEFPACGRGKKIVRSWEIINWCTGESIVLDHQQIELIDSEPPVITDIPDDEISTDPWTCTATYIFPEIEAFDSCGDSLTIDWFCSHGIIREGQIEELELHDAPVLVTAIVKDPCHNESRKSFYLNVVDDHPPVPRCHNELVISLSQEGTNQINLEDFNLGSYDDGCGDVWFKAIRADELNRSVDGYWNDEGRSRQPDYELPPEPVFFPPYPCDNIGADDYTDDLYFDAVTEEFVGFELSFNQLFFDDEVSFCCDDIGDNNLEVILRVFDKDPGEGPVDPRRYQAQQVGPIKILDDSAKRFIETTNQVPNDLFGRYAECRVRVQVRSKLIPELVCNDVSITCVEDIDTIRPSIILEGLCGQFDIVSSTDSFALNDCGLGQQTRDWFIDLDQNGTPSFDEPSCTQHISVERSGFEFSPYSIKWPRHFDGTLREGKNLECDTSGIIREFASAEIEMGHAIVCQGLMSDQVPIWCNTECGLIGQTVEVDTVVASDACLKIIRRWTVVDWCVWQANSQNFKEEDSFIAIEDWTINECDSCLEPSGESEPIYFRYEQVDEDGFYEFDQVIKVIDETPPVIDMPDTLFVELLNGQESKDDDVVCDDHGSILLSGIDFCGFIENDSPLKWVIRFIDGTSNPMYSYAGNGIQAFTPEASPGDTIHLEMNLTDACGNEADKSVMILFVDGKAPVPLCVANLQTGVNEDGHINIWASDFDIGSFDNCGVISHVSAVPSGRLPLKPEEVGFADQQNLKMHCDSIGLGLELDIWFWDQSGNADFCSSFLTIPSGCGLQNQGQSAQIGGSIASLRGEQMEGVNLLIQANNIPEYPKQIQSDEFGDFMFDENPIGYDYSLLASTDDNDLLNGISTFDILQIQQHLTGRNLITNPYLHIAADVNNDKQISPLDIITLRNALLGLSRRFPNNGSWRFIDQREPMHIAYIWPIKERINVFDLATHYMDASFMGIKVGDINMTVSANNKETELRHTETSTLYYETDTVEDEVVIQFYSEEDLIHGFQFSLQHHGLELTDIKSGVVALETGHYSQDDHSVNVSWSNESPIQLDRDQLFTLIFKAKELLQPGIVLDKHLHAEIYSGNEMETKTLVLVAKESSNFSMQIFPNPFTDQVDINLSNNKLPSHLFVTSLDGKILLRKDVRTSNIQLHKNEFNGAGLYFVQLIFENGDRQVNPVMLVD